MTIELGVLLSVLGLAVAFGGYQMNKAKAVKTDAHENAELKVQIGFILSGIDDIKIDLKANDKQLQAFGERLTRTEESCKQAHKRINKLEQGED